MKNHEMNQIDLILESPIHVGTVEPNIQYKRFEDMSPTGSLAVFVQDDGDVIVSIVEGEDYDQNGPSNASVEFCTPFTGGGQSPRVRRALMLLAEAIRRDNEERAQYRQG